MSDGVRPAGEGRQCSSGAGVSGIARTENENFMTDNGIELSCRVTEDRVA